MKKASAFIMTLIMVMSLMAGCGKASTSTPANNGSAAPSGNSVAGESTTIQFWHTWQGLEAQKFAEIIKGFSEVRPDIQVEVLDSTTEEKQLIAMTSGDPFDVGLTMDYTANKWASKGALADMTPFIKANGTDMTNYVQPLLNIGKVNDGQYGIPFTMDTFMLFYNKDILAEAGFADPPKTWEEFSKICEAVTKTDDNGDYSRVGCIPNYPWVTVAAIPYAFGGSLFDFDTNTVLADSPEVVGAMSLKNSLYTGFYDNEKIQKFKSGLGQYQSAENPFFSGKVAFSIEGEWYPTFLEEYAPDLNWGVVPLPAAKGKEAASSALLQGGMLVIPEGSKQKEAAYAFVEWLTSDAGQVALCVAKGNLPATRSGLDNADLLKGAPSLKPFIEYSGTSTAKAIPALPFMGEYTTAMTTIEEQMYNKQYTPEEAMAKIKMDIQPIADKWAAENK